MAMDATRTISGSYGEVWHEGKWLTNFNSAEAAGEINFEEINRSGTRIVGQKATTVTFSGNIKGLKVSSKMTKLIGQIGTDRGKSFVTELIMKLDDPESYGAERIRLKGVQFSKIDLLKFEAGSLVETELPFVFTGYDLLDEIKEA
jgi:hypothetical protein